MQFFLKSHWKKVRCGIILLALYAGIVPVAYGSDAGKTAEEQKNLEKLESENRRLAEESAYYAAENKALRKELIETLDKYSTQAGQLRCMQMGTAGTIETLEPVYTGAREMELAADLQQCIDSMKKLSAAVMAFADEFDKAQSDLSAGSPASAKLRIQLDSLKDQARETARTAAPAAPPSKTVSCRILELDRKSHLVILSGGYRDGVRTGMVLVSGETKLKVLAVRNYVCAAALLEGREEALAVGAAVKAAVQEHR